METVNRMFVYNMIRWEIALMDIKSFLGTTQESAWLTL